MAFKISNSCNNWFFHLFGKEPFKRIFDYYYLCAIIGIAAKRKREPESDAKEFVDDFLSNYKPYQRRLVGLLAAAYLDELGVGFDEKVEVARKFADLVSNERSSNLTDKGFNLLNAYCQGGFDLISEELEKPHDTVFFLDRYNDLLAGKVGTNKLFGQGKVPRGKKHSKAKSS